jgi:choline-sulfatase
VAIQQITQPGARSKTPVSLLKALPTRLELCGLPQVPGLDGTSFMPDLREPAKTRDTTVFAEHNLGTAWAKYMIRRGDYKYNYYVKDIAELCNLRDDPKEMRNLALEFPSAAKVAEPKAQLFARHQPQGKIIQ